jgi:hypothetical protein
MGCVLGTVGVLDAVGVLGTVGVLGVCAEGGPGGPTVARRAH